MSLIRHKGYGIYKTLSGQYAILGEKPLPTTGFRSIKAAKLFIEKRGRRKI